MNVPTITRADVSVAVAGSTFLATSVPFKWNVPTAHADTSCAAMLQDVVP